MVSRWATHHAYEALEKLGNRLTCPGTGYGDRDATDILKTRCCFHKLIVGGVERQNDQNLARAQSNAGINQKDQAIAKWRHAPCPIEFAPL